MCVVYVIKAHISVCLSVGSYVCGDGDTLNYDHDDDNMNMRPIQCVGKNSTSLFYLFVLNATSPPKFALAHTHTPRYTNTLSVNEKERKKYTSEILIIFNYRWLTVCVRNEWKRIFISRSKESTN